MTVGQLIKWLQRNIAEDAVIVKYSIAVKDVDGTKIIIKNRWSEQKC